MWFIVNSEAPQARVTKLYLISFTEECFWEVHKHLQDTVRNSNLESPVQFENQIKPLLYVRRITRSTMYKSSILLARTGVRKIVV